MTCLKRFHIVAIAAFVATLSITSALAAGECIATPIHSENGTYEHCEVIRGTDIQFLEKETTPKEACALVCSALSEMDQVANESRALDRAAGLAE